MVNYQRRIPDARVQFRLKTLLLIDYLNSTVQVPRSGADSRSARNKIPCFYRKQNSLPYSQTPGIGSDRCTVVTKLQNISCNDTRITEVVPHMNLELEREAKNQIQLLCFCTSIVPFLFETQRFGELNSVSIFRWNLVSWAQSKS
jgi:hypothetical protein